MKRVAAVFLALILLFGMVPMALADDFTAVAAGFGGEVSVTLTIQGDTLADVVIVGEQETAGIGSLAIEGMPKAMLEANSVDVDGISGATITSDAIKAAAAEALSMSGAALAATQVDDTLQMTPGIYTGSAEGMTANIAVEIEVTEDAITRVTVGENGENENIGTLAFPILEKSIVKNQSLADTVSGATFTSMGINAAVKEAMSLAGASDAAINAFAAREIAREVPEDTEVDIVVVGAGMAGMVAAMKADDEGASVILLEKTGITGGSARLSHSAIWAVGNEDTIPIYDFNATEVYGFFNKQAAPVANKEVFYTLANRTGDGVKYLKENGLQVIGTEPSHGKMDKRFNAIDSVGYGPGLCATMDAALTNHEIDLRVNSSMVELIQDERGAVNGVVVETDGGRYNITAKKVILATGGFTYNEEMLKQYDAGTSANNMLISAIGGTGDGHIAGVNAGGHLVGEGTLLLYCVDGTPDSFFSELAVMYAVPMIVDDDGDQIAAMDEHYTTINKKLTLLNNGYGTVIHGSDLGDTFVPALERAVNEGIAVKADTIEELASRLNMDPAHLNATIEGHNQHFDDQTDDDWTTAAASLMPIKQGPFYAYRLYSGVMGTITGLAVNPEMQVMTEEGAPVENLYAIGELMFGNVFNGVYPMSGTALTMCVSSGLVSAESATQALK